MVISKNWLFIFLIFLISLFLFYSPIFSGKPLGLDAIGHLSKVSYINQFGFTNWNYVWYSGCPFLMYYSPLNYILTSFFANPIFGMNFLGFLSIFLTSLGIYLLVLHYIKDKFSALFSSILFLTTLCLSYFFISVGNHPYFFSLMFIPFGIYFFEKSFESRYFYLFYCFTLFLAVLSHVFIGICLFFLCFIRVFFISNFSFKNLFKRIFIFNLIPGFLSSFWWLPFLGKSSYFSQGSAGYIPSLLHLFGFGNYIIWGKGVGELGIGFILFIVFLLFFLLNFIFSLNKKSFLNKNKDVFFILISLFIFFFLLKGGLGNFYPYGMGAIRFILPFSVLVCIFCGLIFSCLNKNKIFVILIFFLLAIGLIWNFSLIQDNFKNYSYNSDSSRYAFLRDYPEEIFENSFTNYRFGSLKYIYGEPLNYFYPGQSQLFGYYDQAPLFPQFIDLMNNAIWGGGSLNSTVFYLDWFSINKFEVPKIESSREKFNSSLFFNILEVPFYDYSNLIFSYFPSVGIISLIKGNYSCYNSFEKIPFELLSKNGLLIQDEIPVVCENNESFGISEFEVLNFTYKRDSPEKVYVFFSGNQNLKNSLVLFKESYHNNWVVRDIDSKAKLDLYVVGPGFMGVFIDKNSKGVIFSFENTWREYLGLSISIFSLIFLLCLFFLPIKSFNEFLK